MFQFMPSITGKPKRGSNFERKDSFKKRTFNINIKNITRLTPVCSIITEPRCEEARWQTDLCFRSGGGGKSFRWGGGGGARQA